MKKIIWNGHQNQGIYHKKDLTIILCQFVKTELH